MPGYGNTRIVSQSDGSAVTGTAEASLLPGQAKLLLPGNDIHAIGRAYRLTAFGRISNIVTTPGTLTMKVKLGPTSAIAVATSSAWQLNAVAKTAVPWWLDLLIIARSVGSGTSATLFTGGEWCSESVVGSGVPSAGGNGSFNWQSAGTPAVGTGFDSTIDNILDLTATFSLTGNSMTCHGMTLTDLNYAGP